jgi:hypothetical protein
LFSGPELSSRKPLPTTDGAIEMIDWRVRVVGRRVNSSAVTTVLTSELVTSIGAASLVVTVTDSPSCATTSSTSSVVVRSRLTTTSCVSLV